MRALPVVGGWSRDPAERLALRLRDGREGVFSLPDDALTEGIANDVRGALSPVELSEDVAKHPAGGVPGAGEVREQGLEGDRQRDLRYHGGPLRAVCLYSAEAIDALRAEGHPIAPGSTGENLTIEGIDWGGLSVGDRLQIGQLLVEITGYAAPCSNIAGSFADGLSKRISQKLHPGWSRLYARVLAEATVRAGDQVAVLAEP